MKISSSSSWQIYIRRGGEFRIRKKLFKETHTRISIQTIHQRIHSDALQKVTNKSRIIKIFKSLLFGEVEEEKERATANLFPSQSIHQGRVM